MKGEINQKSKSGAIKLSYVPDLEHIYKSTLHVAPSSPSRRRIFQSSCVYRRGKRRRKKARLSDKTANTCTCEIKFIEFLSIFIFFHISSQVDHRVGIYSYSRSGETQEKRTWLSHSQERGINVQLRGSIRTPAYASSIRFRHRPLPLPRTHLRTSAQDVVRLRIHGIHEAGTLLHAEVWSNFQWRQEMRRH